MNSTHDLIIVGGSAAAVSAGIYAARRGLNFKIITKDFGGEVATSGEIGNWPGIAQTDGITLANQFKEHLKFYNVIPEEGVEVEKITKQSDGAFCIKIKSKSASDLKENPQGQTLVCGYVAKTVIIATGVHPRELNIPGEKEFRNKGVSYCTVCDGPLFSGKTTAVIGGGNSALEAGLMLADISSKVYVINKNLQFKGDDILIENLKKKQNVEIIYSANTTAIIGDKFVTGLKYADKESKEQDLKIDGTFIHIGMVPNSYIVPPEVQKNNFGEIVVNKNCETNIPGLYAAGDVTDVPFNQIVIAAGQGCIATLSAVNYLNRRK
ncbi:MAG: FAD-dependent oxidoreductase [Candidatus Yanofskybacteria bacterium]|nr:FAD-dependent oxidoreductase [Candidatus Yanofskybacteria bacterium]